MTRHFFLGAFRSDSNALSQVTIV